MALTHALISISGTVDIAFDQTKTLAQAGYMIPKVMENAIESRIHNIPGVRSTTVRCGILDLEEVST